MQSPSSLCSRCKVLQFNDEEHGRVPKHPSSAEMQVTYNKFDDNTSYDVDWEDILICKKQGIFLDYDLLDEFPDLPVLSRSSAAGCGMCTAMREKILQVENSQPAKSQTVLIYKFCLYFMFQDSIVFISGFSKLSHLAVVFKLIGRKNAEGPRAISFDIQTEATDPCREWLRIMREPVEGRPFSEGWMAKLQNLTKRAFSKSKSQAKVRYVPTRLIDVGDANSESRIRLVIPNSHLSMASKSAAWNKDRKYIALSYCWGRETDVAKQLKTTTDSLEKNLKNIEMKSLPKTIHDAVVLCRVLEVRYLWVDALCIIQDDRDDCERESSEMAQIYENSCFTLCDLQGDSCQSGFLKGSKRDLIKIPFQSSLNLSISGHFYICDVPGQCDEVFDNSLFETHPDNETLWESLHLAFSRQSALDRDLEKSRWNTRGWTFQEALSSPRLLLFGTRAFHFVALQEQRSQDSSFSFHCLPWSQSFHWDVTSPVKSLSPIGWRQMADTFSYRNFSFLRDRLPAMSALARKDASETTGQYMAGIWGGQLETDLLWVPLEGKLLESFLRPVGEYIAPSWSWACQYGAVTWPHPRSMYVETPILSPEFQIVSMDTVTGLDNYGRVQSGFISLETKICELPSSKVHRRRPVKFCNIEFPYELYSANDEYIAHLRFDWTHYANDFHQDSQELQKHEDDNLVALLSMVLISSYHSAQDESEFDDFDDPKRMLGLLVLPTRKPFEYHRAGIFLSGSQGLGGQKFWDKVGVKTFTLV